MNHQYGDTTPVAINYGDGNSDNTLLLIIAIVVMIIVVVEAVSFY